MRNFHTANPVNIIIADNQIIFRRGFCTLLKKQNLVNIIDEVSNGEELLHATEKKRPHVIITDIQMPVMNGIEATRQIKKSFPDIQIIALSDLTEDHYMFKMLDAGASGFLLKNTTKEEILLAVKTVNQNETYYCNGITNQLLRSKTNSKPHHSEEKLHFSDKEIEVIKLICEQYSTKEIADKLNENPRSIDTIRERIKKKTHSRNMVGITLYAVEHGIYFSGQV